MTTSAITTEESTSSFNCEVLLFDRIYEFLHQSYATRAKNETAIALSTTWLCVEWQKFSLTTEESMSSFNSVYVLLYERIYKFIQLWCHMRVVPTKS